MISKRTLSFLSFFFFFWKRHEKPPKKTRIFYPFRTPEIPGKEYPYRTPEIPGKEGKNARKNKELVAREKKHKELKKKQGKEGQGKAHVPDTHTHKNLVRPDLNWKGPKGIPAKGMGRNTLKVKKRVPKGPGRIKNTTTY